MALVCGFAVPSQGNAQYAAPGYASKFHVEDKFAGLTIDTQHPIDAGTTNHTINDFRPEPRDVFHLMDQVVDEKGQLQPLNFDPPSPEDQNHPGQQAIYGRNTWLLWCAGNEDFWDWLAQDAYGVSDFLRMLDSRKRGTRFRDLGLINQPGLKASTRPGPYGLYLDEVERFLGDEGEYKPFGGAKPPFRKGNDLQSDGVNPMVYGYPSGVIGLRLFPNPKFDEAARKRWNAEAFYNDPVYAKDPRTVRPFLVGMSCAICHVAVHPLNPPRNPEEPQWSNLSSIIGNQYFRTSAAFGSSVERGNFIWHYLSSQQPGTIDTSMVTPDHINNPNAMNAVFELPARLTRARLNPAEVQGAVAQTLPGEGTANRLIARVLMDGADSIGVFGALARVYLNIGLFHDEWNKCSNPIIGMVPQKPFSVEVCRRNSVYWRVNENFRIGYLAQFFLWDNRAANGQRVQCSTSAMRLKDAREASGDGGEAKRFVELPENQRHWDEAKAAKGSVVFARNCMVCHSSKQPTGYAVEFALNPPAPATNWQSSAVNPEKLVLPMKWANWEDFKRSPAYTRYAAQAQDLAGNGDPAKVEEFRRENFFSTDLRVPVSLTETPSGRALATNAKDHQVWAEYSSDTYRRLPAVGPIPYYDPFTKRDDNFQPDGNGPGYFHVPSLVSIWATAPLLHNNALGKYVADTDEARRVSVAGRLEMFDDAIEKLLWKEKRGRSPSGEGGLRETADAIWRGSDPGWIFRTDMETELRIPNGHIRHLVMGVLPGFVPGWLLPLVVAALDHPWIAPFLLALLSLALLLWLPRGFFYLLELTGIALLTIIPLLGLHYLLPWPIWLLPLALIVGGLAWINCCPPAKTVATTSGKSGFAETGSGAAKDWRWVTYLLARWGGAVALVVTLLGLFVVIWAGREFVNGQLGDLRFGPLPKGTPVNALMNINPESSNFDLLAAVRGLTATVGQLRADDRRPPALRMNDAQRLALFEKTAGPALMRVSKCPDFVMDRGHYFGEALSDEQKRDLIAFLKTL